MGSGSGSLSGQFRFSLFGSTLTRRRRSSSSSSAAAAAAAEEQMIANACRSFIRFDRRVIKLANTYHLYKPVVFFQGCKSYHGLSFGRISMEWQKKKQKTVKSVWKPISTQAEEGCLTKDVKVTSGETIQDVNSKDGESKWEQTNLLGSGAPFVEQGSVPVASTNPELNVVNEGEKHSVSIEVGASLIRFIKGKGGSTQKLIEEETGVKIIFPDSKKENSIAIEGDSTESLTKASEKIQVILEEAVKSPTLDYSHFISLPLAIHPGLVDKLISFQNSILEISDSNKDGNQVSESDEDTSDNGEADDKQIDGASDVAVKLKVEDKNEHVKVEINKIPLISYPPKASKSATLSDLGIDRSIFIKPKTFHLTVLMLKLWNKERIASATEVLQRVSSKVIDALDNRPLSIRLKGLESMTGSLAKARVLYAPVEEIGGEDRLLRACQIIIDAYVEAGLVLEKDAQQKLKLHATVMNARHRKRKIRTKRFDSFDARGIVKQYGSEDWGEYLICEAHLSQRFFFNDSGYYHYCTSIPFPENKQVE